MLDTRAEDLGAMRERSLGIIIAITTRVGNPSLLSLLFLSFLSFGAAPDASAVVLN
jgi:hypothetical protein